MTIEAFSPCFILTSYYSLDYGYAYLLFNYSYFPYQKNTKNKKEKI